MSIMNGKFPAEIYKTSVSTFVQVDNAYPSVLSYPHNDCLIWTLKIASQYKKPLKIGR